jgi:hypothetical protein
MNRFESFRKPARGAQPSSGTTAVNSQNEKCKICDSSRLFKREIETYTIPFFQCRMCQCAFFQTDLTDIQLMEYYDQTYPHYLEEEISEFEKGNYDYTDKKVATFKPFLDTNKFERFIEFGSSVPLVSARLKQLYPNLSVTCIDPNEKAMEFGVRHGVETRSPQDDLGF